MNPETTACFTGHRNIPAEEMPRLREKVAASLQSSYAAGYNIFLCGGARGFDTAAAQEVIRFREVHGDVRLILAIPCITQADHWNEADRTTWKSILEQADDVRILSKGYYNGCMHARDRFMVDASSLCLCWMTKFEGGTWYTVRYALHCGVPVKNLAMPDPKPVFRENVWNCMYTFLSASENAPTVHLFLSQLQRKKKMHMSFRFSGKRL